jgi:hypothetical protein
LWIEFINTLTINENKIKKVIKQFGLKETIVFTTNGGSNISCAIRLHGNDCI